jgi:serine protease Do
VAGTKPGAKVPVKVLRDGSEKLIEVQVKELPGDLVAGMGLEQGGAAGSGLAGLQLEDITPEHRSQLQLPTNLRGVIVAEVNPESAAFAAGIRPGHVIVEVNKKPVASTEDAMTAAEKGDADATLLRVWSKGGARYVVLEKQQQEG